MVVAVIPARFESVRLPGKMLADIGGKPMVVRVWEIARRAVDEALVATDDDAIADACAMHGIRVLRTGRCASGTDRVASVLDQLGRADVVVNVQGDEPLIDPDTIRAVAQASATTARISTGAAPYEGDPHNPARVKVVTDATGNALYFSRLAVPYTGPWWQHVGVYAFPPAILRSVASLPCSALERSEKLEQLRWLEAGYSIRVVAVGTPHPSVDTPADLATVRALWSTHPTRHP